MAAVGVHTVDSALSVTWLSVPPLASHMHISGSDSETVGVKPRPNAPGAEVRQDE